MAKASNLSAPQPEIIKVENDVDTVCCDGGGGALGHPNVYYSFGSGAEYTECDYCDRVFVKKNASKETLKSLKA